MGAEVVSLDRGFRIWSSDRLMGDYLSQYFHVCTDSTDRRAQVFFSLSATLPEEAYTLTARDGRVEICASGYPGLFNGAQTLFQILPPDVLDARRVGRGKVFSRQCTLPSVDIYDYPCFSYRGQHLDVARTYIPIGRIEKFIDDISHFKINKLHLHLVDDEAWRIEIKKYPELALIGGYRGGDSPIFPTFCDFDKKYGGYYTQDELKSLVGFAAARNIEIIPEIDLPGHSMALGKVHPEFLCPVSTDTARTAGYDLRNVLCVSNEAVYSFLDDIFAEVTSIFPSEHIHVGGDEVRFSYWKSCPHCSELYRSRGFESYKQVETVFMKRMEEILAGYGRKLSVWNEAGEGDDLSKETYVHGWKNPEACRDMVGRGYKTIIMPGEYCYFDMYQSDREPGAVWNGVVDVWKTYSLSLEGYSPAELENVVGFEGAFWTELLAHNSKLIPNYFDYQLFPRLIALAEVAWTRDSLRNADDFRLRLEKSIYPLLDKMGTSYRADAPAPGPARLTPQMKCTTSFPLYEPKSDLKCISEYGTEVGAWTKRCCRKSDWILYEFTEPVSFNAMELVTGYHFIPRAHIVFGHVEASYDGSTFIKVADLEDGRASLGKMSGVKAIRIICDADGNGSDHMIIQCPRIY
ncbi:MAG: family 20 glycosylhydrolase [Bacteroidales bacterium]|nr:family 20 glycosylhydrolase [Bacteroidales bacterium]